jgi:hypothetical protein
VFCTHAPVSLFADPLIRLALTAIVRLGYQSNACTDFTPIVKCPPVQFERETDVPTGLTPFRTSVRLVGNLVSTEEYQILVSTRDVAQAEFLQRKFHSRRIPCTTLNLLGLGKDGVEWSVQSSCSIGRPQH